MRSIVLFCWLSSCSFKIPHSRYEARSLKALASKKPVLDKLGEGLVLQVSDYSVNWRVAIGNGLGSVCSTEFFRGTASTHHFRFQEALLQPPALDAYGLGGPEEGARTGRQ